VFTSKEPKHPKDYSGHTKNGTTESLSETKKFKNNYPVIPYNYPIANPRDIITNATKGWKS